MYGGMYDQNGMAAAMPPAPMEVAAPAPAPAAPNGCGVFIGNIAWATTSEELAALIAQVPGVGAPLSCEVARTRTGRSIGYAIAQLATPEAAAAVIGSLNEYELADRRLFVREDRGAPAKSSKPKKQRALTAPVAEPEAPADPCRIFIGNLAWATTSEELTALVAQVPGVGVPVSCEVGRTRNGRSTGYGTATLASPEAATAVIGAINGHELAGRRLIVREDRPKSQRRAAAEEATA